MEYRDPALVGQAFPNASQLMKKLSNEALQVRPCNASHVRLCPWCVPSLSHTHVLLTQHKHKPQTHTNN